MNLKKCRQILNAIALLVVIIVFASNIPLFNSIHKEMIYVSIFLIIIDIIFGFTFLRCPHCKKLLNFKKEVLKKNVQPYCLLHRLVWVWQRVEQRTAVMTALRAEPKQHRAVSGI